MTGDVARRGAPDQINDESTHVDHVRRSPPAMIKDTCVKLERYNGCDESVRIASQPLDRDPRGEMACIL